MLVSVMTSQLVEPVLLWNEKHVALHFPNTFSFLLFLLSFCFSNRFRHTTYPLSVLPLLTMHLLSFIHHYLPLRLCCHSCHFRNEGHMTFFFLSVHLPTSSFFPPSFPPSLCRSVFTSSVLSFTSCFPETQCSLYGRYQLF